MTLSWCYHDMKNIAGDTSYQQSCPTASVDSVSSLRSRSRGLEAAPGHRGPAGGPWRRVAPGGGPARDAPALSGDDACWLWREVWRLVCVETSGTPVLRAGLCQVQSAQAYVTHTPSRLCERRHGYVTRFQDCCFLLSTSCGINGLANSHTVFCTPHRPREGGR
jgi:hypothetical protein